MFGLTGLVHRVQRMVESLRIAARMPASQKLQGSYERLCLAQEPWGETPAMKRAYKTDQSPGIRIPCTHASILLVRSTKNIMKRSIAHVLPVSLNQAAN